MVFYYLEFVQRMQSIYRKPSGYPAAQKRGNRSEEVVEGHRRKAAEKQTHTREGDCIQRERVSSTKMRERRSTEKTVETFSKTSGPELILTHIPNLVASSEQKKDLKTLEMQ